MTPIPVRSRTLLALAAILCLGLNNPVWSQDKEPEKNPSLSSDPSDLRIPPRPDVLTVQKADESTKDDEKPIPKPLSEEEQRARKKLSEKIDRLIEDYNLTPRPLPAIPDDPPPHEGAMIDHPQVIEPPDLLLVEVLDALPGRPISGERLVRPDGKIELGFYGNVHVAGLTLDQAKVKIIKHLRKILTDETLGLLRLDETGDVAMPSDHDDDSKSDGKSSPESDVVIHPVESDRIFLRITAYNYDNYYILGDFAAPGRLPITGRETVLDALQHGGGFLPTADQKSLRLIRPARGGKSAKIYPIDLEAIQEKGDATANYQIFPGDRLVVGRLDVVKKTIEVDRVAALQHSMIDQALQEAFLLRAMQFASPENKNVLLKDAFEFWLKQLDRKPEDPLDEKAFRELLERLTKEPPAKTPQPSQ